MFNNETLFYKLRNIFQQVYTKYFFDIPWHTLILKIM